MELAVRKGADVYVPTGAFRELTLELRQHEAELANMPALVVACCDRRTRMLPFVIYDRHLFPAGARTVAGALYQAGFSRTRAIFQLWNPNFTPTEARVDGLPPQLLLVSSLGIHSAQSYRLIREAWSMGPDRPLIIAGGPKAIYEPYHFWPLPTPGPKIGPDVVVTGEAYVLLDLLRVLMQYRGRRETLREAFQRARREGALQSVPGLVYVAPWASYSEPELIDTGLQRLVQDFDELPDEVVGLSLLEPPHRGRCLSPRPLPLDRVRRHNWIVTLQFTQGCKFACSYCPIPAVNQKTWRYRSPEGIARQLRTIHDQTGIRYYFGTDDNFFNRRETAENMLEGIRRESSSRDGRPLGRCVRWGTEATQFDTYKNRDLLPLAREAGMTAIWFGIEDLTAELVNKGQKPEVTIELFKLLHANRILPMAMMMYHDGQPFYTRDSLYGISNQMRFLQRAGAVSVQCTVHVPAVGTKEYERTFDSGKVFSQLGSTAVDDRFFDGNHIVVRGGEPDWRRQLKFIGAYASFYNPLNFLRALRRDSPLREKRTYYQLIGMAATGWTFMKTMPHLLKLVMTEPKFHEETPPALPVPVQLAAGAFPRLPIQAATLPVIPAPHFAVVELATSRPAA